MVQIKLIIFLLNLILIYVREFFEILIVFNKLVLLTWRLHHFSHGNRLVHDVIKVGPKSHTFGIYRLSLP